MDQEPGTVVEVGGVRRLLAPNPSPLTGPGTNTYLVGRGEVVVIDPGPDEPAHEAAIVAAVDDERVAAILVTHAHLDHSALAPALSRRLGAPVLAFGEAAAGRDPAFEGLTVGGGEGVDAAFAPDRRLADGEVLRAGGVALTALHTPGHFGNHLAFAMGDVVLTGDLVMGWATTLISPPDGSIAAFRASCAKMRALGARLLLPAHGEAVTDPAARIDHLLAHRREREHQIVEALAAGPSDAAGLVPRIYADVPRALWPAAQRNVLAHLLDLHARGEARALGPPGPGTRFARP